MPDSRVTVPIEDFAQTMRSLIPRYASASDERLIDLFASENPQCRLIREGPDVSLENLSSILTMEAEREAEAANLRSEPAPVATSSPVMVDEAIESGRAQGGGESDEMGSPASTIDEPQEQIDANESRHELPSFGSQEEKGRPVALWVACCIGVLAFSGGGIYYAEHAQHKSQNTTAQREAAPAPDAKTQAPETPPTVQEHPADVVPPAPPAAVKTDLDQSLPALGAEQLFQRFQARNGERDLIGKRIRLRGKIETLGENGVSLMGHDGSQTYWFDVHGFGGKELNSLKPGDIVEVVCEYTGSRASTGNLVQRWSFHGLRIRKTSAM